MRKIFSLHINQSGHWVWTRVMCKTLKQPRGISTWACFLPQLKLFICFGGLTEYRISWPVSLIIWGKYFSKYFLWRLCKSHFLCFYLHCNFIIYKQKGFTWLKLTKNKFVLHLNCRLHFIVGILVCVINTVLYIVFALGCWLSSLLSSSGEW